MKFLTLALVSLFAASTHASSESILKKVDSFLGDHDYKSSFNCGDEVKLDSKACVGTDCETFERSKTVTVCGEVAEITYATEQGNTESTLTEKQYNAISGNPLRLATGSDVQWLGADAVTINFLGVTKEALFVYGHTKFCEETKCTSVPVQAMIVKDVAFIARLAFFGINDANSSIEEQVKSFAHNY